MSDNLLERYFTSANTEDWALMAELWTDDCVLSAVGFHPVIGKPAVLEYFPRVLAGYAEHLDTPTRVITSGDVRVVEIHFLGRLRSGVPVEFDAVDVFDLVDGRIAKLSTWYDSKRVARIVASATSAPAVEGA